MRVGATFEDRSQEHSDNVYLAISAEAACEIFDKRVLDLGFVLRVDDGLSTTSRVR